MSLEGGAAGEEEARLVEEAAGGEEARLVEEEARQRDALSQWAP